MNDALERDNVINLLDKLGSEQDEEVLAAARALHAQITEAGMSWQDLLVADDVARPSEPATNDATDDTEDEEDIAEPATEFAGDESETPKLIDKLLAREGNSDAFREELEEYKTDLANGKFEPSDHRYIQALYARLTNSG